MVSLKKSFHNNRKIVLTLILSFFFLITFLRINFKGGILHTGGYNTLKNMLLSLLKPDFSPEIIIFAKKSCCQTFSYALISI